MSKPTFTPGPWRIVVAPLTAKGPTHRRIVADAKNWGQPITVITANVSKNGNADLISAAPDLYVALDRLLGLIEHEAGCPDGGFPLDGTDVSTECDVCIARAALTKARGE